MRMDKKIWFFVALAILVFGHAGEAPAQKLLRTGETTSILVNGIPRVTYVHAETPAPAGEDTLLHRSGYIHPLRSPGGQVLTGIQPPGHPHQYGIFSSWARTRTGDREVDFWNLGKGQGRTRFREYMGVHEEEGMAGFKARHDHIYVDENGNGQLAIDETWEVMVHTVREDSYVLDLTITQRTDLEGGILLERYRYGGLAYRGIPAWGGGNSTALTSEGKSWAEADSTRARWVIVEGESQVRKGRSGILFMSHPSNREHPEPIRMFHPDEQGGAGNMYLVWTPIRYKEWKLEQGSNYTRRYRMVVFDGKMYPGQAEELWAAWSESD